ncbi:hypothetical protein HpBT283_15210 [Helicobacter pylori]
MPKKELLKMSKKRIFKDFLKEAKQHRPIVFYTDNDCDCDGREALKNAQLSQIEEILTGCIFNGAYRLQNDLKGNR